MNAKKIVMTVHRMLTVLIQQNRSFANAAMISSTNRQISLAAQGEYVGQHSLMNVDWVNMTVTRMHSVRIYPKGTRADARRNISMRVLTK